MTQKLNGENVWKVITHMAIGLIGFLAYEIWTSLKELHVNVHALDKKIAVLETEIKRARITLP